MIYFMVLSGIAALLGLVVASAATGAAFAAFGYALFLFGVGFAFFLLKAHFDEVDAGG